MECNLYSVPGNLVLEVMWCRSYRGEEADPVKLSICAGWESAECHEREDEESYPCDDIEEAYCTHNAIDKTLVKFHPSSILHLDR